MRVPIVRLGFCALAVAIGFSQCSLFASATLAAMRRSAREGCLLASGWLAELPVAAAPDGGGQVWPLRAAHRRQHQSAWLDDGFGCLLVSHRPKAACRRGVCLDRAKSTVLSRLCPWDWYLGGLSLSDREAVLFEPTHSDYCPCLPMIRADGSTVTGAGSTKD